MSVLSGTVALSVSSDETDHHIDPSQLLIWLAEEESLLYQAVNEARDLLRFWHESLVYE